MEEDFSFDNAESFIEESPQEAPVSEAPAVEAPPQPDATATELAQLKSRLEAAEQWKADMGRMLLGQQPQQAPQPQDKLQEFVKDPEAYEQRLIQAAAEQAMNQQVIADRRAKHPDLAKVEHLIDWDAAMRQSTNELYKQTGRAPTFAEALDATINSVRTVFPGLSQPSQAQQQGDATRRVAMSLDLSGGQPSTSEPPDPFKIPDSEWPKYLESLNRA